MAARALGRLEALLTGIYDLDIGCRVEDFLVTDRGQLPGECRDAPGDEQLFVASDGDELCMTLYLDAGVLERLERHDPSDSLDGSNLADCWTALEGISHFLCVAHNAAHDRPVSRLALEMQAEIDKYVACVALLRGRHPRRFPSELHALLFRQARPAALPTVLDESAILCETILVSGGRRGLDLELAPNDLLAVTGGRYAPIARER